MTPQGDLLHVVTADDIAPSRVALDHAMIWGAAALLLLVAALQTLHVTGRIGLGFTSWRPTLYAYITWAVALCWGQVIMRG